MNYEVRFRKEAAEDLRDSFVWYNERKQGLGSEFLSEIEKKLKDIQSNPLQFPAIHKNIRRALVKRFPFTIFYLLEQNKIVIGFISPSLSPLFVKTIHVT
jgi:toxin ParE1/3/4